MQTLANTLESTLIPDITLTMALKRYGTDFSASIGGSFKASAAETEKMVFLETLLRFYATPRHEELANFEQFGIGTLLDYLKRTHALYLSEWLPKMEMTIKGIQKLFPEHPVVDVLDHFYRHYQNELLEHIELEETKLFPLAEGLIAGVANTQYSVAIFEEQHDHQVEDQLQLIMKVIEDEYPEVAQTMAYRSFGHLLQQFSKDLEVHHLIEEGVFLSKVAAAEKTLQ